MIKKTLLFENSAYHLSVRNNQLVIKLPEIERNESLPELFKEQSVVTKP
ncbi:MAG: type II CRISPR-associated endonuclease Cas1, partial [Tannerellaceae bacterium]|nr:type II CRISPR-associated endonuclease Cas1 [Tannerellaceae bacterium]